MHRLFRRCSFCRSWRNTSQFAQPAKTKIASGSLPGMESIKALPAELSSSFVEIMRKATSRPYLNNNMKPSCIKRNFQYKKKVNFQSHVRVQTVATRAEMDKDSLWYSSPNYQELLQQTLSQLSLVNCLDDVHEIASLLTSAITPSSDGKTIDIRALMMADNEDDCCTRRQFVAEAVDAILDVQVHQWAMGHEDPEVLAAVSRKYSSENQHRAQLRAALAALLIHST